VPKILAADWVLPVEGEPIADGAVVIEDGRISAVGPVAELGVDRKYECAAIVPGFVNAHSHLEYASYAGFGDGLAFTPWIALHIERKGRLGWDDHLDVARLGAAQCLASGITTVGDASFSGAAAVACAELGLRAVVHLEVFGRSPDDALARFAELRARAEPAMSARVSLGVSPHAPYSVSDDVYRAAAGLGLPVMTHLAESEAEVDWLRDGTGAMAAVGHLLVPPCGTTGIRRLADAGMLGPHVVAAHCVHLTREDLDLLAAHDVAVAHCPRSNALLGCGIAPLADLRAASLRVGLGTDSPASTPSFDVFDELRTAVELARARERQPDALTATDALELATLGSASALGLADSVGSLVPGKQADLAVVSLEDSPFHPWEDPAAAVVFGGSPDRILATLVGGEIAYERGGFEWHELRLGAASARSRMLASAAPAARLR
jgi:cytosine/adenosine deaminase-related metal-dependent hydrolase